MKLLRDMNIKKLVLLSWALPGALVVLASLVTFGVTGWADYQRSIARTQEDLEEKARVASRRLSAELLLGSNGAVEAVSRTLEKDLELSEVRADPGEPTCASRDPKLQVCATLRAGALSVSRKVEISPKPYVVVVTNPVPGFFQTLNFTLFMWSALPILGLVGIGLVFQRALLEHFLVRPIGSLVETSLHAKDPAAHWPAEIRDISTKLADSFEDRDQAIFGRIAGGVIHDLKTLLQSIRIAQELASEAPAESSKRLTRLESLLKTVSINVPKMLKIIELTLDGSREIPVRTTDRNLAQTLQGAVDANVPLAKSQGVSVKLDFASDLNVLHDSIQFERVMSNLIKNAIEAFDSDSSLGGDASRVVRVSASPLGEDSVRVRVEDSGPGLPQGTDRAFRILRSTKPHGAGLGLSVARKIVEAHGGSIEAGVSDELLGAAFLIELPNLNRGMS